MALKNRLKTDEIILDTLIKNRHPLNLYRLSQKSKLTHQRIRYVLPRLIRQGLVLPVQNDGKVFYTVQRIHLDRQLADSILKSIVPLMKRVYSELDLEHVESHEDALASNLALFISRQVVM